MAADRLCCWTLVVVLVFVAAPAPCAVQAAPNNSSLNCGKEPEHLQGLDGHCTCEEGCDAELNLMCVTGQCRCQPDTVIVNQTCLLKSHYNQSCQADPQCQDPHQLCDSDTGSCRCQPGFNVTADWEDHLITICRPTNGSGRIGDKCQTVADCSWRLEHASCPNGFCTCQMFYFGEPGGLQCRERDLDFAWTWWITICVIGAVTVAVGLCLILSCTVRECCRSHKRIRGRVIAVAEPAGLACQAPPPYVAVIDTKPPAKSAPAALETCMDNYGFTSCELEPYATNKV